MSILGNLIEENDDFIQSFIPGMKDAQANIEPHFNEQSAGSYDKLKILISAQNNIKEADLSFARFEEEQHLNCIVPQKIILSMSSRGYWP